VPRCKVENPSAARDYSGHLQRPAGWPRRGVSKACPKRLLETINVLKSFGRRKAFSARKQLLSARRDGVQPSNHHKAKRWARWANPAVGRARLLDLMRLLNPPAAGADLRQDIAALDAAELRKARRQMQMIFRTRLPSAGTRA